MAKITPAPIKNTQKLKKQISIKRIIDMLQFIAICYLVYCQLR